MSDLMSDFAMAAEDLGMLFISSRLEIATGAVKHYGLPDVYEDVVEWAFRQQQEVDPDCSLYYFYPGAC